MYTESDLSMAKISVFIDTKISYMSRTRAILSPKAKSLKSVSFKAALAKIEQRRTGGLSKDK